MRKLIVFVLIITTSMLLCSCKSGGKSVIVDNDHQKAQQTIEMLLETIQNKDASKLKTLFSKNILNQLKLFDESVNKLFNYFNGSIELFDDGAGPFVETTKDDNFVFQIMESSFIVKTDVCEYRFAMRYITEGNTDDIGIVSLYVIKSADDKNSDYVYWGDGKFTPGIHIGIANND